MKPLRIVFMGTPEFAVASLKMLVENSYSVVGVITAPDRPAGRGQKIRESAVKKYALTAGLPILQPPKLKDPGFLSELRALKADLQVVVAFRMLPPEVWKMPKLGTFNLHASLLPDYRGAAPINWAIINGETETGVTTFFIDEKIDTGAIIYQERTSIPAGATAGTLHDLLMEQGAKLVLKTVTSIEAGKAPRLEQSEPRQLKTAPKIHKETCKVDWTKPGEEVENLIRGLSPYPTAWTVLVNEGTETILKIYAADFVSSDPSPEPGSVAVTKKAIKVGVKDGYMELKEIQLAGKKKMAVSEVLNGLKIAENAKMA